MVVSEKTVLSHGFEWSAVIAGTTIALAISIVLLQFGSALGLSASAPLRGEGSIASWGVIAAGIWLLWVQLLASLAGGYTAGYMRSPTIELQDHENDIRDGLHGLVVWSISTVMVFIAVAIFAFAASYIAIQTDTYENPANLTNLQHNSTVIFTFISGATALLSAVAAWWAGTMGGDHKRKVVDLSGHLSFRKKI
ncbi:hypothetical protein [Sneathiella sp.]|uniref:hypothetical protein n=1 Tax=Sneathiella sp. TaxID=1964365 RepID=UPI003566B422